MSLQLTRKQIVILVLSIMIAALIYTGIYFFMIKPIKQQTVTTDTQMKSEQKLLEAIQNKSGLANGETQPSISPYKLQKRVPVKPLEEQFLLDLEKAEVVSNSYIVDMEFTEVEPEAQDPNANQEISLGIKTNKTEDIADEANGEQGSAETDGETAANNSESETAEKTESQEATPTAEPVKETLPAGLRRLTVKLNVESKTYYDMEKFIQTLESQQRITKVDALEFTGIEEIAYTDEEVPILTYTLTVSTFYYPELEDLKDSLPKLDSPEPAKKDNPMSNYIKEEKESKKDDTP